MTSGLKLLTSLLSIIRFLLLLLLLLGNFHHVHADDPGITKARLIQQTDSLYLFEADVPQNILSSIQDPVFPDRFSLVDFAYEDQSGWITLRWTARTSGDPLLPDDEILLPWIRNGVDFTVQWLDGTTYKGLFNRSLSGIHIPMSEVMLVTLTTQEVLANGFWRGMDHFMFKGIHLLLIVVLVWSFPARKALSLLLWYTLGQAASMVWAEFAIPRIDLLFSDLLIVLFVFVTSYWSYREKEIRYAGVMLLTCGVFHGLSYASDTLGMELDLIQRIQSLFAFNLAIDVAHFAIGALLVIVLPKLKAVVQEKRWIAAVPGSLSVFLLLLIFAEHIAVGQTKILNDGNDQVSMQIPVTKRAPTGPVQRGTGLMTTPIMVYLSVEPFEIRQEVLVQASEALKLMELDPLLATIAVEEQEALKTSLGELIADKSNLRVGNRSLEPAEASANFVRLSRGGVTIRETPVDERTEESIIGITYVYDIPSFPETMSFRWDIFPEGSSTVETSVVDPHGAFTTVLNNSRRNLSWKSRLAGFQLPAVEPIAREQYPFPLASSIIWLGLIAFLIYRLAAKKPVTNIQWMIVVTFVGFVLYPFVRTPTGLGFIPQWTPSKERSSLILGDLLSNVYRAFDRRQEDAVYDRLTQSVTGDQLTEIYLENRQAMALQNRGGARAKVDEVNVLDVFTVDRSQEDGFVADASWTVRGSVNHFGHTHYRQNQYRALVTFIDESGVWKISDIEAIDEKRIY